jgi:hypothetical protein
MKKPAVPGQGRTGQNAKGLTVNIGKAPPRALESFRMVPDRLWSHPMIEPLDVTLWCCLTFLARGRDHCEATDQALAGKLGTTDRTIRRSLARLESCQFIGRHMDGVTRVITLKPEGDGQPSAEFTLRVLAG